MESADRESELQPEFQGLFFYLTKVAFIGFACAEQLFYSHSESLKTFRAFTQV